uniref:Piwi domain-containing protein n=1 Tax=Oryza meridionalis TaxID=40149 RepID=A0A0E0CY42_9ORYZ
MDEKDGNNGQCNFSTEDPGEDKAFAASLVDPDPDPTDAALLDNECSRAVDQDPAAAAALLYNECSAAYGAHVKGGNVENWACVNFSLIGTTEARKFVSELKNACVTIGMDLKFVYAVFIDLDSPNDIESTLHDVQELFGGQGVEVNQINLLVVILPEFRCSDEKIKDICKNLGFLYHCGLPEHARTPNKLYLNNVAHNIRTKRVKGDSEEVYGSDEMREDSESDLTDLEDMGDADSDIIYLEAFPTSDEEMDDDDYDGDDDEYVSVSPDEEMDDDGSVQQMGENDVLCKQLQQLEDDDGHEQAANSVEGCLKTYKEIEAHTASAGSTYSELSEPPSFEAFLCPEEHEHILKTGWGTQWPYKKPSGVSWDEYSKVFDTNGYYKLSNMPVEDKDLVASHVPKENPAECNTRKVRRWGNHIIDDDYDELQGKSKRCVVKNDVRRRRLDLPLVSEVPTIVFGAHTIHYDLGEDSEAGVDSEGIASVAASLDWPKFRNKFFRSFYKMIKERPKRIVFYRGGLMEGEMDRVCVQEIDAIKQACAYSYKEDQPSLTYVVVVPTASIGTEADTAKYKFFCRHTTHKLYRPTTQSVLHSKLIAQSVLHPKLIAMSVLHPKLLKKSEAR